MLFILFFSQSMYAAHYYSRVDGAWGTASTWSTSPSGTPISSTTPGAKDDVTITHSVEFLIGTHYTHLGDIVISASGDLGVMSRTGGAKKFTFAGTEMSISGGFSTTGDFFIGRAKTNDAGTVVFHTTSNVEIGDDMILNAHTNTIINTATCSSGSTLDDIYFVGLDVRLCGTGAFVVPDALRVWDDDGNEITDATRLPTIAGLMCDGFDLYSSETNCDSNNPIVIGIGDFVLGGIEASLEEVLPTISKHVSIIWSHTEGGLLIQGLAPNQQVDIRIVQLPGQVLFKQTVQGDESGNIFFDEFSINLKKPGIMIVQVFIDESRSMSRKFIRQ